MEHLVGIFMKKKKIYVIDRVLGHAVMNVKQLWENIFQC